MSYPPGTSKATVHSFANQDLLQGMRCAEQGSMQRLTSLEEEMLCVSR